MARGEFRDFGFLSSLFGGGGAEIATAGETAPVSDVSTLGTSPNVGKFSTKADAPIGSGIFSEELLKALTGDGEIGGDEGFKPRVWNGVTYTDPVAYKNAVDATILENFNTETKQINDMFNAGLKTAAERDDDIRDARGNLGRSRDSALQGVKGFFSSVSPNAIQSQQRTRESNVQDEFGRGSDQLGSALPDEFFTGEGQNRTFRGDLTPEELSPFVNDLSSTGSLLRGLQQFGTDITGQQTAADLRKQQSLDQSQQFLLDEGQNAFSNTALSPTGGEFDIGSILGNIAGINPQGSLPGQQVAGGANTTSLTPEEIEEEPSGFFTGGGLAGGGGSSF